MGDQEQYREIYRMLLRQLSLHSSQVSIQDLATFVVQIQREVVRRDQQDALQRLKNSLIKSFRDASRDPQFITQNEFVICMIQVDKRAPWDHYDRFLQKTYNSIKRSNKGILFQDYIQMIQKAFSVSIDTQTQLELKAKLGQFINLDTFLNLNSRLEQKQSLNGFTKSCIRIQMEVVVRLSYPQQETIQTANLTNTSQVLQDFSPQQESLNLQIAAVLQEINLLQQSLTNEKHANRMLVIDYKWLQKKKAQYFLFSEQADQLEAQIKEETTVHQSLKREKTYISLQHAKQEMEATRKINPKLFPLKKKLLELQEHHLDLKEYYDSIQDHRSSLSQDYSRLTNNLKQQEKIKFEIIQLEKKIKAKDLVLEKVKKEHQELREELKQYQDSSSSRKQLQKLIEVYKSLCNNIQNQKKFNQGQNNKLKELDFQLEQIKKGHLVNAGINPSEQIRKQLRRLQQEITARSKQIIDKQADKARLTKQVQLSHLLLADIEKEKPKPQPVKPKLGVTIQQPFKQPAKFSLTVKPVDSSFTVGSTTRRKKASVIKLSQQEINRRKVISDIENSVNKGKDRREIADILKGLGDTRQSLLTQLVKINRSAISISQLSK